VRRERIVFRFTGEKLVHQKQTFKNREKTLAEHTAHSAGRPSVLNKTAMISKYWLHSTCTQHDA